MSRPSPSPSMGNLREHKACRVCGSVLESFLDLGMIAPSNFVPTGIDSPRYPLDLCQCVACGLAQLRHTLDLDQSYRRYWYKSGLNQSMVAALVDVIHCALRQVNLAPGDVAVDIGCNDGTLLQMLPPGVVRVGFDPALNLAATAREACHEFVNDYFSADLYPLAARAKLITSIAMFYDVPDPSRFVADIARVLSSEGIWVIQMMDFDSMLTQRAFDNICFEHLIYYSLDDLKRLIEPHGLEVFHVSHNSTNGGSLRAMICHKGQRVISQYAGVSVLGLDKRGNRSDFVDAVEFAKQAIRDFIQARVAAGQSVYAMGASTKGNTLLQYFRLDSRLISKAAEVNRDKWGLETVATQIPIADEAECLAEQPDFLLVLPWHFIGDFIRRNQDYLNRGGAFIVPLPQARLIDRDGVAYL